MDNKIKFIRVFAEAIGIDESAIVNGLQYNSIPEWDSIAHMTLIAALEGEFDIMLDTDDIIDMRSVEKAKEILAKYDVHVL